MSIYNTLIYGSTFFAVAVVITAAVFDVCTSKIPNKLTFPASAIGILLQISIFVSGKPHNLFAGVLTGFLVGCSGWIAGVFIMSITKFFMPKFGYGDTKLMAALGAIMGPGMVFIIYFYYCLCFGIFGFVRLFRALPWKQLYLAVKVKDVTIMKTTINSENFKQARTKTIPVAPFIALGTILAILLKEWTLQIFSFK